MTSASSSAHRSRLHQQAYAACLPTARTSVAHLAGLYIQHKLVLQLCLTAEVTMLHAPHVHAGTVRTLFRRGTNRKIATLSSLSSADTSADSARPDFSKSLSASAIHGSCQCAGSQHWMSGFTILAASS